MQSIQIDKPEATVVIQSNTPPTFKDSISERVFDMVSGFKVIFDQPLPMVVK
jgi:hypothetical protein